jgi:hypothetical protein
MVDDTEIRSDTTDFASIDATDVLKAIESSGMIRFYIDENLACTITGSIPTSGYVGVIDIAYLMCS